jgi:HAD superfamily hydrolase (TIGR01662 family)
MIKAVLFDWDLTLAKTFRFRMKLFRHLCKLGGIPVWKFTRKTRTLFGMTVNDLMEFAPSWASKRQAMALYKMQFKKHSRMIDFIGKSLVEQLHADGYKVAIVTNDLSQNILWYLKKHQLAVPVFDTNKSPKPSPKVLAAALKKLNVKPSEAAYVGDHPRDVQFGKNAGVKTIALKNWLHGKRRLSKEKPDAIVSSLGDVPRYLRGW